MHSHFHLEKRRVSLGAFLVNLEALETIFRLSGDAMFVLARVGVEAKVAQYSK